MKKERIVGAITRIEYRGTNAFFPFFLPLAVAVLSVAILCLVNPSFVKDKNIKPAKAMHNISYDFYFSSGENTAVLISPPEFLNTKDCKINAIWINPANDSELTVENKINKKVIYSEHTFDLAPWLKEGMNKIVVNSQIVPPWERHLSVRSRLYGTDLGSSLACISFFLAMASILYNAGRKFGLDRLASSIVTLAMLYLAKWLISFSSLAYTSDLPGHLAFTYYMASSPFILPYGYTGHEDFHPFSYYFFTGRILDLFRYTPINPVMAMRVASLFLYSIFMLYGVRTLALAIRNKGVVYYISAILIAFWPVGILKATNVNNDIAVYAIWSVGFYYLVSWYVQNDLGAFRKAIVMTGLLFMVKSNAWVLLGMGGIFTLYGLYSHRLKWRDLLHENSLFAFGVLITGIILNFGRIIYCLIAYNYNSAPNYFGYPRDNYYDWGYLLNLGLTSFLKNPYVMYISEPGFFNYFLKTALYTETAGWGGRRGGIFLQIPYAMNFLLVGLITASILAVGMSLWKKRENLDSLFPYLASVFLCVLASMMFTYFDRYVFCQNFRYVLPMLVPFVILYAKGMETLRDGSSMLKPAYWLGCAFGLGLPLVSTVLFLSE